MLTGAGAIALSTGWIALGGIATALGAVVIYWGAALSSRADVAGLERKMDDFFARLEQVRDDQSAGPQPREMATDTVEKISEDFVAWANEFAENRHYRHLQFKQAQLGRQTVAAEMTAKWRPLLRRIFDLLKSTIAAYNEKLGCYIKVDLPDVPEDLFANPYNGVITFGTDTVWKLQTECTGPPPRTTSRITLWIYFQKSGQTPTGAAATIQIDLAANEFEMFAHGADVPFDIDRVGTPLNEFSETMAHIVRQLVEAQLLKGTSE